MRSIVVRLPLIMGSLTISYSTPMSSRAFWTRWHGCRLPLNHRSEQRWSFTFGIVPPISDLGCRDDPALRLSVRQDPGRDWSGEQGGEGGVTRRAREAAAPSRSGARGG